MAKGRRRAAKQKRIETRQNAKTERQRLRSEAKIATGDDGIGDELLEIGGGLAGAAGGLLGGGALGALANLGSDPDDDDDEPLPADVDDDDDESDGPTGIGAVDDAIEWAQDNPEKVVFGVVAAVAIKKFLL